MGFNLHWLKEEEEEEETKHLPFEVVEGAGTVPMIRTTRAWSRKFTKVASKAVQMFHEKSDCAHVLLAGQGLLLKATKPGEIYISHDRTTTHFYTVTFFKKKK